MARVYRTSSTSAVSNSKVENVTEIAEIDIESISEEAQDMASVEETNPQSLFIQPHKLIMNSNVVDSRSEMTELTHRLLVSYIKLLNSYYSWYINSTNSPAFFTIINIFILL